MTLVKAVDCSQLGRGEFRLVPTMAEGQNANEVPRCKDAALFLNAGSSEQKEPAAASWCFSL